MLVKSLPLSDIFLQKRTHLQTGANVRVLDICAGAGGFSLGFQSAGYKLVGAIESDPDAASSYAVNLHKDCKSISLYAKPRDLTMDSPRQVAREFGLEPVGNCVDVILGGLPCQAFARIGRSKLGALAADSNAYRKDPRANLYRRFLVFVRAFKPLCVILDNVPDILNYGGHNVPEDISRELEAAEYRCRYTLLNAVNYRVPQMRERLFPVAIHESIGVDPVFPSPTHWASMPPGYTGIRQFALKHVNPAVSHYLQLTQPSNLLVPAVTACEAIGDLRPILRRNWTPPSGVPTRDMRETSRYRKGQSSGYSSMMRSWEGFSTDASVSHHIVRHTPRDYALFAAMGHGEQYPALYRRAIERFEKEVGSRHRAGEASEEGTEAWRALKAAMVPPYDPGKFPNKWRKLRPDSPSWTVTAHLGKDSYSHIHYDSEQARTISVREAARIQSFPDGFVFSGSMNSAFRQIGNAVPPLLAEAIARSLLEVLTGRPSSV
jgi:DNA (cytosine-5)-methyltransferase 1